jgi:RNA polymerase sigma factor (TIGR02999 family)
MSALTSVLITLGINHKRIERVPATVAEIYNTPSKETVLNPPDGEVTRLLAQIANGSEEARDRLFELIVPELCRIASAKLRHERAGHSLTTTDLVHEAFLRFADQKTVQKNRTHLYAVFAMMMRRVLIDRAKRPDKRCQPVTLHPNISLPYRQVEQIVAVHECLEKLEREYARASRVVELRFFGGLSNPEVAEVLDISLSTVEADWRFARAWLLTELGGDHAKP